MAFISHPLPTIRVNTSAYQTRNRCPVMKLDVLLTGAGGRTGRLVFEKLIADTDNFNVTGIVHNLQKAKDTYGSVENLVEGDVTNPESFVDQMKGKDALIVLTSASPRMNEPVPGQPPSFRFDDGGTPEIVEWQGGKNQIDSAKENGLKHVIFVGSMGSTDDNHPLNKLGNGNILKFKRKAEMYLIDSGIPYTIINPAGLTNDPDSERELILGNGDKLFSIYDQRSCSIPRGDIARVVFSALTNEAARNKAFDIIGRPIGDGQPTVDVSTLFSTAGPDL